MSARSPLPARASRWLGAVAAVSLGFVLVGVVAVGTVAAVSGTPPGYDGEERDEQRRLVRAAAAVEVAPVPEPAPEATGSPVAAVVPTREAESREALVYLGDDGERITVQRVHDYLRAQGSPLADHADAIVTSGVRHGVDPRLVIAISAAESSFGTRQLGHNAWGWGASTTAAMVRWPDWPTAIESFTAGLAANYDVDDVDESFAQTYVPPNWRWWLDTVEDVMSEI